MATWPKHCANLSKAILDAVAARTETTRRSMSQEVVYLCELALSAGPLAAYIDHEERYLGDVVAKLNVRCPDGFDERIEERCRLSGEDRSEAYRALLLAGLAMADKDNRRITGYTDASLDALADLAANVGADIATRATAAIEESSGSADGLDQYGAWLAEAATQVVLDRIFVALMEGSSVGRGGQLHVVISQALPFDPEMGRVARARHLAGAILRLVAETPPGVPPRLYPEQIERAKALVKVVRESDEAAIEAHPELELLWSHVQPGMMFVRGNPEARRRWEAVREKAMVKVHRELAKRTEVDLYLRGEVAPDKLDDPVGAREEIQERLAPIEGRLVAAEAEQRGLDNDARPLRQALAKLDAVSLREVVA